MITCGIDGGSRTVKVALVDDGRVLATAMRDQGIHQHRIAEELLRRACAQAGIAPDAIAGTVATGYARAVIRNADRAVTEITCHARGVAHLLPQARSIIEIGGQDSKVIRLEAEGAVADFAMNDRCAAGTGRFLEMVAVQLETDMDRFAGLCDAAATPADISSMCVVFAESEIIGLLAAGREPSDILVGVEHAIADRIAAMAGRLLADPVAFTGGVALVPGMRTALAQRLGREVATCPHAAYTGAIGAALLAAA
ncbi:MAG: acyl-CoA dehydratase activase [Planctomycetota bacterium]